MVHKFSLILYQEAEFVACVPAMSREVADNLIRHLGKENKVLAKIEVELEEGRFDW